MDRDHRGETDITGTVGIATINNSETAASIYGTLVQYGKWWLLA
jgi:hypothetical protein